MPRLLSTKTLSLCAAAVAVLLSGAARAADEVCQAGSCLANGDTPCDRATASCPPCMYAISGGYSCYGKVGTECPYPDTLTICPEATATVVVTPAPFPTTAKPEETTATPTVTTAAPTSSADVESPSSSTASASSSSSASSHPDTSAPPKEADSTAQATATVAPFNGTHTSAPTATDPQDALTADNKSSEKESPQFVNIAIIVGAAVGVLVVVVFIIRRMRQRREAPVDMGFDDLGFKSPQQGGGKEFATVPMSSRRANNESLHTAARPMTERIDFSTLEPEPMAVRTKSRRKSSRPSSVPSSVSGDSNSMDSLEFSVGMGGSQQKQSFSEDRPMQLPTMDRPRAKSRARGLETSLIQKQFPELVGSYGSDVSSLAGSTVSDDFDIVDPGAIRPGERRNTETLVADGRFRQFSTASLAESYVSDATTESSEYGSSVYI